MYKLASLLVVCLFAVAYGIPSTYDNSNKWVAGNLSIPLPKNAIIGGMDFYGYNLYIGRVSYGGEILPTRVIAETGTGYFNSESTSSKAVNYQLLTTEPDTEYVWVRSFDGFLEENAISVGTTPWDERVYICRTKYTSGILFGTLYLSKKVCNIKHDNAFQSKFDKYEVLVANPIPQSAYH